MKTFFLAPALILSLALGYASADVLASGPEGSETPTTVKSGAMASKLEYRFFENRHKPNTFTLALERTATEPAAIRILAEDGSPVYRAGIEQTTLVRHFDMRPLQPGRYTVQITSGTQQREQTITIE